MAKRITDADRFRELLGRATLDELKSMKARLEDAMAFRFPADALNNQPKRKRKPAMVLQKTEVVA